MKWLAQKFNKRNSDIHYSTDQQRKTKEYLAKSRNYGEFEKALNAAETCSGIECIS